MKVEDNIEPKLGCCLREVTERENTGESEVLVRAGFR